MNVLGSPLFHLKEFSSRLAPKLNSTTVLAFHHLWRRLGNHLALPCLDFGRGGSFGAPWPPFSRLCLSRLSPQQNLYFYTMKLSKWRPRRNLSRVPFFSDGLFRSMKSIISAFTLKRFQKQLMPNHHFCLMNLLNRLCVYFARLLRLLQYLLFRTMKLMFPCFFFWLLPRAPCEFVTLYQDIEDLGDSSRLLALSLATKNQFSDCKVMIFSLFTLYWPHSSQREILISYQ